MSRIAGMSNDGQGGDKAPRAERIKLGGVPAAYGTWEDEANDWVKWARTPGHDVYWAYAPRFFEEMLPAPGRRTLELGCGEGRVVRDLTALGHRVVGVDSAPTMLDHARASDSTGTYVLADAAELPFADGEFDLVVAYNSLMDVDDLAGTVREAERVLEPGGALCVCVTHPLNDAGAFTAREADATFGIQGSYLARRRHDATFERDGLRITFHGWLYPLEAYARAVERCGMLIDRVREPAAPAALVASDPRIARWQRIPMFLWIRALAAPH